MDKNLYQHYSKLEFVQRSNITNLIRDVKNVTADLLADGDKDKAKSMLEGDLNDMTRADLCVISFYGGGIMVLALMVTVCLSFRKRFAPEEYQLESG
jgi:hypothetical protein